MSSYNSEINRKSIWINLKNLKFATFEVNSVHHIELYLIGTHALFKDSHLIHFFLNLIHLAKNIFFPFFSISKVKKSKGWVNVNTNRQKMYIFTNFFFLSHLTINTAEWFVWNRFHALLCFCKRKFWPHDIPWWTLI